MTVAQKWHDGPCHWAAWSREIGSTQKVQSPKPDGLGLRIGSGVLIECMARAA